MNIPLVILIYCIVSAAVLFAISLYGEVRRQIALKRSHERNVSPQPRMKRESRPAGVRETDSASTRKRSA